MTADIIIAPEPFTARTERFEACEGTTLAAILRAACQAELLDPQDLPRAEVFVDGKRLHDRLAGLDYAPRPGALVNIVVMPQGGGGGSSKILSTVLEVALIAATAWVAGPGLTSVLGPAGAWTPTAGFRVAQLAAAGAVAIGGSALLPASVGRAAFGFGDLG